MNLFLIILLLCEKITGNAISLQKEQILSREERFLAGILGATDDADAIGNVQDPDNVDNNEIHGLDDQPNVDKDDIMNSLGKQINYWRVSKDKGE